MERVYKANPRAADFYNQGVAAMSVSLKELRFQPNLEVALQSFLCSGIMFWRNGDYLNSVKAFDQCSNAYSAYGEKFLAACIAEFAAYTMCCAGDEYTGRKRLYKAAVNYANCGSYELASHILMTLAVPNSNFLHVPRISDIHQYLSLCTAYTNKTEQPNLTFRVYEEKIGAYCRELAQHIFIFSASGINPDWSIPQLPDTLDEYLNENSEYPKEKSSDSYLADATTLEESIIAIYKDCFDFEDHQCHNILNNKVDISFDPISSLPKFDFGFENSTELRVLLSSIYPPHVLDSPNTDPNSPSKEQDNLTNLDCPITSMKNDSSGSETSEGSYKETAINIPAQFSDTCKSCLVDGLIHLSPETTSSHPGFSSVTSLCETSEAKTGQYCDFDNRYQWSSPEKEAHYISHPMNVSNVSWNIDILNNNITNTEKDHQPDNNILEIERTSSQALDISDSENSVNSLTYLDISVHNDSSSSETIRNEVKDIVKPLNNKDNTSFYKDKLLVKLSIPKHYNELSTVEYSHSPINNNKKNRCNIKTIQSNMLSETWHPQSPNFSNCYYQNYQEDSKEDSSTNSEDSEDSSSLLLNLKSHSKNDILSHENGAHNTSKNTSLTESKKSSVIELCNNSVDSQKKNSKCNRSSVSLNRPSTQQSRRNFNKSYVCKRCNSIYSETRSKKSYDEEKILEGESLKKIHRTVLPLNQNPLLSIKRNTAKAIANRCNSYKELVNIIDSFNNSVRKAKKYKYIRKSNSNKNKNLIKNRNHSNLTTDIGSSSYSYTDILSRGADVYMPIFNPWNVSLLDKNTSYPHGVRSKSDFFIPDLKNNELIRSNSDQVYLSGKKRSRQTIDNSFCLDIRENNSNDSGIINNKETEKSEQNVSNKSSAFTNDFSKDFSDYCSMVTFDTDNLSQNLMNNTFNQGTVRFEESIKNSDTERHNSLEKKSQRSSITYSPDSGDSVYTNINMLEISSSNNIYELIENPSSNSLCNLKTFYDESDTKKNDNDLQAIYNQNSDNIENQISSSESESEIKEWDLILPEETKRKKSLNIRTMLKALAENNRTDEYDNQENQDITNDINMQDSKPRKNSVCLVSQDISYSTCTTLEIENSINILNFRDSVLSSNQQALNSSPKYTDLNQLYAPPANLNWWITAPLPSVDIKTYLKSPVGSSLNLDITPKNDTIEVYSRPKRYSISNSSSACSSVEEVYDISSSQNRNTFLSPKYERDGTHISPSNTTLKKLRPSKSIFTTDPSDFLAGQEDQHTSIFAKEYSNLEQKNSINHLNKSNKNKTSSIISCNNINQHLNLSTPENLILTQLEKENDKSIANKSLLVSFANTISSAISPKYIFDKKQNIMKATYSPVEKQHSFNHNSNMFTSTNKKNIKSSDSLENTPISREISLDNIQLSIETEEKSSNNIQKLPDTIQMSIVTEEEPSNNIQKSSDNVETSPRMISVTNGNQDIMTILVEESKRAPYVKDSMDHINLSKSYSSFVDTTIANVKERWLNPRIERAGSSEVDEFICDNVDNYHDNCVNKSQNNILEVKNVKDYKRSIAGSYSPLPSPLNNEFNEQLVYAPNYFSDIIRSQLDFALEKPTLIKNLKCDNENDMHNSNTKSWNDSEFEYYFKNSVRVEKSYPEGICDLHKNLSDSENTPQRVEQRYIICCKKASPGKIYGQLLNSLFKRVLKYNDSNISLLSDNIRPIDTYSFGEISNHFSGSSLSLIHGLICKKLNREFPTNKIMKEIETAKQELINEINNYEQLLLLRNQSIRRLFYYRLALQCISSSNSKVEYSSLIHLTLCNIILQETNYLAGSTIASLSSNQKVSAAKQILKVINDSDSPICGSLQSFYNEAKLFFCNIAKFKTKRAMNQTFKLKTDISIHILNIFRTIILARHI